MPRFLITDPEQATQIFEISKPITSIGRADSNDLILDHPSVSRHHARVAALPDSSLLVTDLDSLNGVFVNDRPVREHRLADSDRMAIGAFDLKYEIPAERPLEVEAGSEVASKMAELLSAEGLEALAKGSPESPFASTSRVPPPVLDRLRDLENETTRLKLLFSAGKALSSALLPEEIMRRVMDLVFQMENVERGFLMLRDEKGGFKPAVVVCKKDLSQTASRNAPASSVVLSRTLIERVSSERLPVLIRNAAEDDRFAGSTSLRLSGVRSAMCAPLSYKDNFFGIFYVDCLSKALAFSPDELSVFAVIAAQAAMSMDNARTHAELSRHALERQALQRFLSPSVVARILSDPSQIRLGGQTQTATILFADIRNFTPMAECMEPHEVVQLLNEFFCEMTEIVFEHGGTLDKYLGDGLMALFGAPIARPDDPLRAVSAAISMKRTLSQAKRRWRIPAGEEFRIGIGINTGKVTAGNIGSAQRMDYTAIGDAVNVAARLCAGAPGGQIMASEATVRELGGAFPARRGKPMRVKGRVSPVEVYEILWDAKGD